MIGRSQAVRLRRPYYYLSSDLFRAFVRTSHQLFCHMTCQSLSCDINMEAREAADDGRLSSALTESEKQQDTNAVFFEGQLSYLGHDVREIPTELVANYADRTVRLDLSFNNIHDIVLLRRSPRPALHTITPRSLAGLERFVWLQELILDNNELGDDVYFPRMNSLTTLYLNKNRFQELDPLLRQLKEKLPQLYYLSLLGNAACPNQLSSEDNDDDDYQRYRYYVLYHLPQLKFLDSSIVHSAEPQEAVRMGRFLQVVRPPKAMEKEDSGETVCLYTPLPSAKEKDQERQHFGKWKKGRGLRDLGWKSEGNRFITDHIL